MNVKKKRSAVVKADAKRATKVRKREHARVRTNESEKGDIEGMGRREERERERDERNRGGKEWVGSGKSGG